jgi:hypothetical protein
MRPSASASELAVRRIRRIRRRLYHAAFAAPPCCLRGIAAPPLRRAFATPSPRLRHTFAFADAAAIASTVAGDDIAHAQPATAIDGRAWPAGVVEEKRRWVWIVAVKRRVDGTYRAGIQHQLQLCGRLRPDR